MVEVTLKPCPFCGGEAEKYTRENTGATADFCGPASHWIGCTGDCGASTCMHEEMAEAFTAWNTRTDEATRPLVEALEAGTAFMTCAIAESCYSREELVAMARATQPRLEKALAQHTGAQ